MPIINPVLDQYIHEKDVKQDSDMTTVLFVGAVLLFVILYTRKNTVNYYVCPKFTGWAPSNKAQVEKE